MKFNDEQAEAFYNSDRQPHFDWKRFFKIIILSSIFIIILKLLDDEPYYFSDNIDIWIVLLLGIYFGTLRSSELINDKKHKAMRVWIEENRHRFKK